MRIVAAISIFLCTGAAWAGPRETAALRERAEKLLVQENDEKRGWPLLFRAFEQDRCSTETLDAITRLVQVSPERAGDLFKCFEKSVAAKCAPEIERKVRWRQLAYAVFFDRIELVKRIVREPDKIGVADDWKRAALGSLLVELGMREQGLQILSASKHPLARYHVARLADPKDSAAMYQQVDGDADAVLLRKVGLASVQIETAGGRKAIRPLADTPRETLWSDHVSPYAHGELILLKVRLDLAEGRRPDALRAAFGFGHLAHAFDPSTLLRTAALVGPLWKVEY
jgi:hypothetical protein